MTLRLWGILGGSLAAFLAVLYVVHIFELAGEAKTAKAELATTIEKMNAEHAAQEALEKKLQASREAYADLNKKWSRNRASKDHKYCTFDDDTIGLLKSASEPR